MRDLPSENSDRRAVLCAVDAGPRGWDVASTGARVATRLGVPLELLHVARYSRWPRALRPLSSQRFACESYRTSEALLRRYAAVSPVPTSLSVREGDASEEIVLAAHERRPPVIVLGSRERSALRSVFGHVSASVMARTAVPVVVVSPQADPTSLDRDGPVLVGVDGSDASTRAVDVASDLAVAMGVDLYCLSVAEPRVEVPVVAAAGASAPVMESPVEIEGRRRASLVAANDVAFAAADGIAAGAIADVGDPATRLSAVAAEMDACLIAVGHAHRTPFDGALRGSVATSLSRCASRPVLVATADHDR